MKAQPAAGGGKAMSEISIRREHRLGLPRARELAAKWAEDAEEQFGMSCRVEQGTEADCIRFARPGVEGTLTVAGDRFELYVKLGTLLAGFRKRIETEVEKNLDVLLAREAPRLEASRAKAERRAKKEG